MVVAGVALAGCAMAGCAATPKPAIKLTAPPAESPDSEQVLRRGRELMARAQAAVVALTAAVRKENAAIKAMRADLKTQGQKKLLVERIMLRKIISVDRSDAIKLRSALQTLLESAVAIALSVRASESKGEDGGKGARLALKMLDGQLSTAESRLEKIEVRQEQVIGGSSAAILAATAAGGGAIDAAEANQRERESLEALAAAPPPTVVPAGLAALPALVSEMRSIESSVEFHTALLSAHRSLGVANASALSDPTEYSRTNFSYGSTPHSSWLAVFEQCPPLMATVQEMRRQTAGRAVAMQQRQNEYCVFGSSLGWLCFYASLTFGLRSTGYELVKPLVSLSRSLQGRHCIGSGGGSVTFSHADMLTADLRNVRVLMLTSHAWDAALCQKLDCKLASELAHGCFVIDYNGRLGLSQPGAFEVVGRVSVATSWASEQAFHVYRRL